MFGLKYRYFFIILLAIYSYLNIWYTVGSKLFDFELPSVYLFFLITFEVFSIWELNRFVEMADGKIQGLLRGKIHPLIVVFGISLLNVVITSFVGLAILYLALEKSFPLKQNHVSLLMVFGFRINLFLNCINAILFYMTRLKKTELLAEQFKKASVEANFEALRNQINPHFLFNCFNTLSNLVYKDADTSAKFIAQLSNVYRYVLNNHQKKIVPLKDELDFIDSYIFLLKIRFGDNIVFEKKIEIDEKEYNIAPGTLQMLIENAIKHNIVSSRFPLRIGISSSGRFLTVTNTLQEKKIKEPSTLVGLPNIIKRYEFLSEDSVNIEKTENEFIVSIPLVEIETL